MKATLNVEGMHCGGCAKKVEASVKGLGAAGEVDLKSKSIAVEYDENRISLNDIKEAIQKTGYSVK